MAGEELITAHVKETGESAYAVTIDVSGHTLRGDEPIPFGGGNLGPAPYDLLLAALGECTAMTMRWYALQQKWPLEKVEVTVTHHKENAGKEGRNVKIDVFEKQVIVHGGSLTDEQKKKLVDIAAKCPVQRTLQSDVIIRTT